VADLTPAQEIRAATALIRERTGRVPQTWCLFQSQIIAVGTDRLPGADVIATCMVPERAAYVASMHPGVALAVADLLDGVAALADTLARNDYTAAEQSAHIAPALKIARACLGSKETPDATD
jgi:hypothetical protein